MAKCARRRLPDGAKPRTAQRRTVFTLRPSRFAATSIDEIIAEAPDMEEYSAEKLAALMCADLGWNAGVPLAAAGFEAYRYRKDD